MKEFFISLCSGLIGVILTIGYQHFFNQPQSFTFYYNGEEMVVTQSEYIEIDKENQTLKEEIAALEKQYSNLQSANADLSNQNSQNIEKLNSVPNINYTNLGFVLDAEEIPINKNHSMITIDGRDYFSKEIIEKLLLNNQNMTIKNDVLFIGKVVTDQANLSDQWIMSSSSCQTGESISDSYGNTRSNAMYFTSSNCNIIYTLNGKYSLMKFTVSIGQDSYIDRYGVLTIKADDNVVYTSPTLNKKTEPFTEIDIPINNCKLLTIEYNGDYSNYCAISDAIVYN